MRLPEDITITMRTSEEVVPIMQAYSSTWFITEAQQSGVPLEGTLAQVASWGTDEERLPRWSSALNDPDHHVSTVRENGRLVGFFSGMIALKDIPDMAYVTRLHLDRSLWGRGIGSILMSQFHKLVGPDKDICLDVLAGNERAIRFYKKHGYDFTGESKEADFGDYKTQRLQMMRKRGEQYEI